MNRNPQNMVRPQIVLLKDGVDTSQGLGQLISNINACTAVSNILKTTLGPMGMDKLIRTKDDVCISNDGATLIKLLDVVHPAAKTLTEIAQSQDKQVGDGTTSVVILAAELLKNAKEFIEEGVHPQVIIKGYRKACREAIKKLEELAVNTKTINYSKIGEDLFFNSEKDKKRFLLIQCAKTALTSKLIEGDKDFFSELIVDSFLNYNGTGSDFFEIKTVPGGSVKDSFIVDGVSFKKTFSYAGFEQQPKKFTKPKIALLNVELELKTEHISGEVRVDPEKYKSIVDAEWKILYDKLDLIYSSGTQIILSKLPIGDLATQYFAEKMMFCAGRVPEKDLKRLSALTGSPIHSSLNSLKDTNSIGSCDLFEEKQIGNERFNIFTCTENAPAKQKMATLILRGGADQYISEASRSLNDAIMVVKNTINSTRVVGGGGAIEMELSRHIKNFSRKESGKSAFMVSQFAKSLEIIPKTLAQNSGLDCTDILTQLRKEHHGGKIWAGVSVGIKPVENAFENFVWEPFVSKKNILDSATEAACLILSVDETLKMPKSQPASSSGGMPMGGGRMPMGGMLPG